MPTAKRRIPRTSARTLSTTRARVRIRAGILFYKDGARSAYRSSGYPGRQGPYLRASETRNVEDVARKMARASRYVHLRRHQPRGINAESGEEASGSSSSSASGSKARRRRMGWPRYSCAVTEKYGVDIEVQSSRSSDTDWTAPACTPIIEHHMRETAARRIRGDDGGFSRTATDNIAVYGLTNHMRAHRQDGPFDNQASAPHFAERGASSACRKASRTTATKGYLEDRRNRTRKATPTRSPRRS